MVTDLTQDGGIATTVRLVGPLGAVSSTLAEHAEAVLMEAVSNAVRHSDAERLTVEVAVTDELAIDVSDNGRGIAPQNQRQSGLANLRRRAEQLSGHCEITSTPDSGTRVHWTAPLIEG